MNIERCILIVLVIVEIIRSSAGKLTRGKPCQKKQNPRSRESLRASELRYRRLFESAKDGILIFDAKAGEITDVNPYLLNFLGYTYDEFMETPLWERNR